MSPSMNIFAATVLLWAAPSAADCIYGSGSCVSNQDETSLLQVEKIVKSRKERHEPAAQHTVVSSAILHSQFLRNLMEKAKNGDRKTEVTSHDKKAASEEKEIAKHESKDQQYPPVMAPVMAAAPQMQPYGYAQGVAPPMDYHYNGVTTQSQVSPGGGAEDPHKASARAAEMHEHAEKAMEDAVYKAQQQERASLFASKRAAALRASAERAATAEETAARAQLQAADSMENAAVSKAASDRTHARTAAYQAIVSQATAYQASADQTFAAQRAAAARAAVESAKENLHTIQDDTDAAGYQFNDRDSRKQYRHRYHDAMDEINYDRERFRDEDEDEDYETDEDEDYKGHLFAETQYGGGRYPRPAVAGYPPAPMA